jgi:hypothetical protein
MRIPDVSITTVSRFVLTAALLVGVFSLPASAARKARAMFIQPAGEALEKAILFTGKAYVEVELPQRNFSPEVDLPDGELVLAVLRKPLDAGQEVPADAPQVKIPEAWSRCLLLFFPDPSNKFFPARVIPVNASAADFPKGHTLVYNVSSAAVMGKFGSEVVTVRPGKSASLKPPVANFGDYPVEIDCIFPGDEKPSSVCRSTWQHDPEARQILFVTPAPGYKVPRVWGILDREQDKEQGKAKAP